MKKILLVGGTFDDNGGKPSGLINKLAESIGEDFALTVKNGGKFEELKDTLETAADYDYVFWFANVDNSKEKIRDVKSVAPHCMLITSKRNDNQKYSLEDLLQRALAAKANLCFEFSKANDKMFNIRVFDPLGCVWHDGLDITEAMKITLDRLDYLSSVTRKQSVEEEAVTPVQFSDKDREFLDIVKTSAGTFHSLMCLPPDVKRFVGNASIRFKTPTRCMSGFPAIRKKSNTLFASIDSAHNQGITKDDYVLISRRNVDKTGISEKNFVVCRLDTDGNTIYEGTAKPSVDTPVQLRLFKALPNIDYILHGHCYAKSASFTDRAIPCGAVEEVDAVLNAIGSNTNLGFYKINLKGHGCLIMANEDHLRDMKKVEFYARPIPEVIENGDLDYN